MKFASIHLENYIGIYNGMGLHEITIDFTRGSHRNIIIRGDNGSGKSTLMKALSVFPDGNENFIPNLPAKKEIVLIDGNIFYTLTFVHNVKTNGQREVTKAYILKNAGGILTQLNENGNVSSFKDILYDELGMDPNFESLSQLSTEDRGIADKKPADRKRFVNMILNNLEAYNDIYKTLTKRATGYKNLISSITAKLGTIGDPAVIASNAATIQQSLDALQDAKDKAIEGLANAKAKIEMLDPDKTIQETIARIEKENKEFEEQLKSLGSSMNNARLTANVSLTEDISNLLIDTKATMDQLNIDNQIKRGQIESLLRERESEASELNSKLQRLQSFEQEWRYESICDEIANNETDKAQIEAQLSIIGLSNIADFTKDSFIMALESLNRVAENISNLKDGSTYSALYPVIEKYIATGSIENKVDTSYMENAIKIYQDSIVEFKQTIAEATANIKAMESLNLRPKDCKDDNCPFVKEAVRIFKTDPESTKQEASEKLDFAETNLKKISDDLQSALETNSAITQFTNFLRDIDRNKTALSKLPCWNVFSNKRLLVEKVFKGDYSEYINQIYSYISYANLFDQYKVILETLSKLYSEKTIYESKQDIVDEIQMGINTINTRLDEIAKQVTPIQTALSNNDKTLIDLSKKYSALQSIAESQKRYDEVKQSIETNKATYNANINKIKQINDANRIANQFIDKIEELNRQISPLIHERDRLNHQMRLVDDYNNELNQLNTQYNLIETVRYYSSPTTGIQLVYMEMYMGNIIQTANQLLQMFFNGQFKILPFVINESEFRIPCAGDGIVNDDISSMSSAQIAMISMILSFSFLYNSSSKYNILKLDEIDGPLDSNNRLMFIDVLHSVMNMMGTEQCIMISHNSELQVDDADIILLKSSENNDYNHGNIIWRY